MKLRNKKTGIVVPIEFHNIAGKNYNSLVEINEDWEDYENYEEPVEVWSITMFGEVQGGNPEEDIIPVDPRLIDRLKEIGNYFETKEAAEKAVEKLKAWKRLKDKGFEFTDYDYASYNGKGCGQVFFNEVSDNINEIKEDLDSLFGGEE